MVAAKSPSAPLAPGDFTEVEAEALRAALAGRNAGDGPLGFCDLAGFLFALACSPEPVMPSE